jgi:hypothetical protein
MLIIHTYIYAYIDYMLRTYMLKSLASRAFPPPRTHEPQDATCSCYMTHKSLCRLRDTCCALRTDEP